MPAKGAVNKMKGKLIVLILFISTSFSHAELDRAWLEFSAGYSGTSGAISLQVKANYAGSGWALGATKYNHYSSVDSYVERGDGSGEELEAQFKVLGVSKLWSRASIWGSADVGIGLGVGRGEWTENCSPLDSRSSYFKKIECDVKEGATIGIPLQISAVFGKYVGIGLSLHAFIQPDNVHKGFAMITIPFGVFTR